MNDAAIAHRLAEQFQANGFDPNMAYDGLEEFGDLRTF